MPFAGNSLSIAIICGSCYTALAKNKFNVLYQKRQIGIARRPPTGKSVKRYCTQLHYHTDGLNGP